MTTDPTLPSAPLPDLDALTALEQAATPGPWRVDFAFDGGTHEICHDDILISYSGGTRDDAEFIAALRNAAPALLSALAATRAELEQSVAAEADRELTAGMLTSAERELAAARREIETVARMRTKELEAALDQVAKRMRERDEARAELARVTEQRDTANATLSRANDEHSRLAAKIREQYDVIGHAKRQRDEALGELEQTRAEADNLRAALDEATDRQKRLGDILRDIVGGHWESGHPGYAAVRSHWVEEQHLSRWRSSLPTLAAPVKVVPAAAPKPDEPLTTPCVAAELNVPHPAHVVSAKGNVACDGAVAGTGQQDTDTTDGAA